MSIYTLIDGTSIAKPNDRNQRPASPVRCIAWLGIFCY